MVHIRRITPILRHHPTASTHTLSSTEERSRESIFLANAATVQRHNSAYAQGATLFANVQDVHIDRFGRTCTLLLSKKSW
jgi:hypothetical protein